MLCDYLCLFMGNFIPFTFSVITDIVRCQSDISLFVFYLSHMFCIPLSIFSCLFFWINQMFLMCHIPCLLLVICSFTLLSVIIRAVVLRARCLDSQHQHHLRTRYQHSFQAHPGIINCESGSQHSGFNETSG